MTTEKAVAKQADLRPAVLENLSEMLEAISGSLAPGERFDPSLLDRVKNPTGGGKNWELADGTATKTIEGVIILRQPVRAYWKERYSGAGAPPNCSSMDLQWGMGDNGSGAGRHACETCPMAQFGTAVDDKGEEAAGQACRQLTRIFVLQPDSALPIMLALPPTSYRDGQRYNLRLATRGKPLHSVVTSIGLDQKASQGGISYSFATFSAVRDLEPGEIEQVDAYRRQMVPVLSQSNISDEA